MLLCWSWTRVLEYLREIRIATIFEPKRFERTESFKFHAYVFVITYVKKSMGKISYQTLTFWSASNLRGSMWLNLTFRQYWKTNQLFNAMAEVSEQFLADLINPDSGVPLQNVLILKVWLLYCSKTRFTNTF